MFLYLGVILPQHPAGHEPFHHLAIWPNPPGTFYRVASHGAISVRLWRPGGLAALFRRTAWCATNNIYIHIYRILEYIYTIYILYIYYIYIYTIYIYYIYIYIHLYTIYIYINILYINILYIYIYLYLYLYTIYIYICTIYIYIYMYIYIYIHAALAHID